jgi:hypothetical protein
MGVTSMRYSAADIAQAEARYTAYVEAEAAVLRNQSYEMDGRKLVRANLADIRKGLAEARNDLDRMKSASRPRGRARRGVIR